MGISNENISRIRISETTDPFTIAELATTGNHLNLVQNVEEAVWKTKRELSKLS